MRLAPGLASFFFVALSTSAAFARDPVQPDPPIEPATPAVAATPLPPAPPLERSSDQVWYGWEPMITDLSALALTSVALHVNSDALGYAGFAAYVAPSPTIHAVRGHWGKAAGSLALRLLLPAAGVAIGLVAGESGPNSGLLGTIPTQGTDASIGLLTGGILAAILDDGFLAKEDTSAPSEPVAPPSPGWHAGLAPTRGGATVGFGATF